MTSHLKWTIMDALTRGILPAVVGLMSVVYGLSLIMDYNTAPFSIIPIVIGFSFLTWGISYWIDLWLKIFLISKVWK